MNEKIPLLEENGRVIFTIRVDERSDHYLNVSVFECTAWSCDDPGDVVDDELYLEAYLKWDACHHVWFGEKGPDDLRDGYMHLCGVHSWLSHINVMEALYRFAQREIPLFDVDTEGWPERVKPAQISPHGNRQVIDD